MARRGRPKSLDDQSRKTICSLVAEGVTLRQVAKFIDCHPKSIRREKQQNPDFRRELAKARSEARIEPLQTLRQAAKSNWRAALSWMERLEPERFARANASIVTKREANQFMKDLFLIIERVVSRPRERRTIYKLLNFALPAGMRRNWQGVEQRETMEHVLDVFDRKNEEEVNRRGAQREAFIREVGKNLPDHLKNKLWYYPTVLDPEKIRADRKFNLARLEQAKEEEELEEENVAEEAEEGENVDEDGNEEESEEDVDGVNEDEESDEETAEADVEEEVDEESEEDDETEEADDDQVGYEDDEEDLDDDEEEEDDDADIDFEDDDEE